MTDQPQDPRPDEAEFDEPHEETHEDTREAQMYDEHGEIASQDSTGQVDPMETQNMLHVDRYEAAWMRISAVVIVIFFLAVVISAFSFGFQLPGVYQRVDPATLYDEGSPWADPGLRELAPGKYELYIRAQIWTFTPNEIHVPAGSEVTFYVTSSDVQHGIKLQGTNINMMILPGQVSKLKAKFEEPGTYQFVCHEYCGQLHHTMYGELIVDADEVAENEGETD